MQVGVDVTYIYTKFGGCGPSSFKDTVTVVFVYFCLCLLLFLFTFVFVYFSLCFCLLLFFFTVVFVYFCLCLLLSMVIEKFNQLESAQKIYASRR